MATTTLISFVALLVSSAAAAGEVAVGKGHASLLRREIPSALPVLADEAADLRKGQKHRHDQRSKVERQAIWAERIKRSHRHATSPSSFSKEHEMNILEAALLTIFRLPREHLDHEALSAQVLSSNGEHHDSLGEHLGETIEKRLEDFGQKLHLDHQELNTLEKEGVIELVLAAKRKGTDVYQEWEREAEETAQHFKERSSSLLETGDDDQMFQAAMAAVGGMCTGFKALSTNQGIAHSAGTEVMHGMNAMHPANAMAKAAAKAAAKEYAGGNFCNAMDHDAADVFAGAVCAGPMAPFWVGGYAVAKGTQHTINNFKEPPQYQQAHTPWGY